MEKEYRPATYIKDELEEWCKKQKMQKFILNVVVIKSRGKIIGIFFERN